MGKAGAIKRDVGEQAKGPRLQRLRAADLALEAVQRSTRAHIFCAVEHLDDVYISEAEAHGECAAEYIEQDKNYAAGARFSFASSEILNTLVAFLDRWIEKQLSENVAFGFYTNAGIAKERETERIRKLGLVLPTEPLLKLVCDGRCRDAPVLSPIKALTLDEYRQQYHSKTGSVTPTGYWNVIDGWSDDGWGAFFERVRWRFGEPDESQLYGQLVTKVRQSRFFNEGCAGREELIVGAILDLLDAHQGSTDSTIALIHAAQIQLIFVRAQTYSAQHRDDPVWQMWNDLTPSDRRGLKEKVLSVCPSPDSDGFGRWCRSVSANRLEQKAWEGDRGVQALRYRVYDFCDHRLTELRHRYTGPLEWPTLLAWVDQLAIEASAHLAQQTDYVYPLNNRDFIRGLVLELVDSCFLAFDSGGGNG